MSALSSRITAEERAFLQELFSVSASADQTAPGKCGEVELEATGPEGRRLLELLSQMETVLLAEDSQQQLRFRLSVVPSPFGGPGRLRLSAPLVAERRSHSQPKSLAASDANER